VDLFADAWKEAIVLVLNRCKAIFMFGVSDRCIAMQADGIPPSICILAVLESFNIHRRQNRRSLTLCPSDSAHNKANLRISSTGHLLFVRLHWQHDSAIDQRTTEAVSKDAIPQRDLPTLPSQVAAGTVSLYGWRQYSLWAMQGDMAVQAGTVYLLEGK
jgi:hypothetical protein